MSQETLMIVTIQEYCLQIRIALTAPIFDVANLLRDNEFIPQSIQNQNIQFKKKNNKKVQGKEMVSSLLEPGQNKCELLIQFNENSVENLSIQSSYQGDTTDQYKVNKILKMITGFLKNGEINELLKSKENLRIGRETCKYFFEIGSCFQNLIIQNEFFQKTLQIIESILDTNAEKYGLQQICEQYHSFVDPSKTYKICQKIKQMLKRTQTLSKERLDLQKRIALEMQKSKKPINRISSDHQRQISDLKEQLKAKNLQKFQLMNELRNLKAENDDLKRNLDPSIMKKEISSLKYSIQKLQAGNAQLEGELKNQRQKTKKERIKIKQLLSDLEEKEEQIKEMKHQLNEEEFIKPLSTRQNFQKKPMLFNFTFDHILKNAEFVKSLTRIIANEMNSQVKSIKQLFFFDRRIHQGYSLKGTFSRLLNKRRAILFVGRSESEDKVFGAFTEQKYQSNYRFTDFNGCSFLFTSIGHEIEFFRYIPGQNSIVYDPNNLVFGNNDLVLDFDKNKCRCKFAHRRSTIYETYPTNIEGRNLNNDKDMYKMLISDQKKTECSMSQYAVFEVQLNEKQ